MALHKISSVIQFSERGPASGEQDVTLEGTWSPNTDVYLSAAGVVVKMEMAGMLREDLELALEGQRLRIRGNRGDECRTGNCNFLLMEISYGLFEKVIELPEGFDAALARATYQNGFLRIDVPRRSEPPKSIKTTPDGGPVSSH